MQEHEPYSQCYEDDDIEVEISIEENKKTLGSVQQTGTQPERDENDPVVQNERLLEKYANMLGVG